MEVNAHSNFIAWLISYYRRHGMSAEDAQSKAIALGAAMQLKLITIESAYQTALSEVQAEEAQQNRNSKGL